MKTALLIAGAFAAGALVSAGYYSLTPSYPLESARPGKPFRFSAAIARVVDGDTVVLDNGLHLRYQNVDAPEMVEMREAAKPLAREALERNRALVEGKTLVVVLSPENVDAHGRLIGSVELPDGKSVEEVLVAEGLARVVAYNSDDENLQALKSAEAAASAARLGIWAPSAAPDGRPPFVASASSKTYHLASCPKARGIKTENLVEFHSEQDARATGRSPCPFCLGKAQPDGDSSKK